MRYTTVIFDLDGTITDSAPGIINAIRYAVKKKGLTEPSEEVLRSFVGPPLREQFQAVFGLSFEEGNEMVSLYREYYGDRGIFENRVYDGVLKMLETLRDAGLKVAIATSKPEKYAKRIAEHFGFGRYFDFIGGACMDGTRTVKHEVIEYVLAACGISEEERDRTVMVGDRRHDILGAKESALHSIGVLYGYGGREELAEAGAEELAKTAQEAADIILREKDGC